MDRKYDLILSLGANCSTAGNLKRRGLRRCSFPFDWLYMMDDRPLFWLAEHLKDGLSGFCLKENLERITPDDPEWSAADARKFKYRDRATGYRFVHLFRRPIETTDEYERVIPVFRRRIDRFFRALERSERVLLLLATGKRIGDDALVAVKSSFERRFPQAHFDLEFIQFDDAPFNEIKSETHAPADGVRVTEIHRAINEYDFSQTNFEWSFLDEIALTDRVLPPGLLERGMRGARQFVRWLRHVRNGRMV